MFPYAIENPHISHGFKIHTGLGQKNYSFMIANMEFHQRNSSLKTDV